MTDIQITPGHEDADPERPLYPEVSVELLGTESNAFSIIAKVRKALERAGHGDEVDQFVREATSGDYDHVIQTAMRWVEVD